MVEQDRRAAGAVEFESDAHVTKSVVGLLKGRDVRLDRSGAGIAVAEGSISILNGGCGPVLANGGITIRNGGCGPLVANGDVSIENGGAQVILAAGGARLGRNAFVGVVVSPKVTIEDGARVLTTSLLPMALGAGVGIAVATLTRLFRR
jgi:hypothetical protein